jgi:NADPH:quinone reductase-like Zn-dependent oxidoreductase
VVHTVLEVVQRWLAEDRFAGSRLVVLTHDGVAASDGRVDVAQAPVWGLVRAAQSENPGRPTLLDCDNTDASGAIRPRALGSEQPELALRSGLVLVPRLARVQPGNPDPDVDPETTVLITGGTGGLGAVIARYLVAERGARHLVLASRRGGQAPGAADLSRELAELGAQVRLVACDISERTVVSALLTEITAERPLSMVVHAEAVAARHQGGQDSPADQDRV